VPTIATLVRILFLCLALAAPAAHAITALWYQRDAGVTGAGPSTRLYEAPTDEVTVAGSASGYLLVRVNYDTSLDEWAEVQMNAPAGGSFALGAFERAARAPFQGNWPGLSVSNIGGGCNTVTGRFTILELGYDSESRITSFAANFEHHCNGQVGATYGELRINSSVPLTMNKPANSILPDPFAFVAASGLAPSTVRVSNPTTIYGINAPSPISITGGEYSVNGAPFTSQAGTVSNRDHVSVRATSPAAPGATQAATLTVGGRSASFELTTYAPGQPLNAFYQRSFAGDVVGAGETLDWRAPELAMTPVATPTSVHLSLAYGDRSKSVSFAAAQDQPLLPGAYELAARTPFRGASPGLEFSGDGRGCNMLVGRFAVLEIERAFDGTLLRFAANFEQWCDASTAPSFGEIRYNSTIPLTSLEPAGSSTPDPFALVALSPVRAGAVVYSNWITVYGANAPAPISVSGGQYSLNGAPFTSNPGTAQPLDEIIVRLVTSPTPGATNAATLTVGGRVGSLSVSTYQQGMSLTGLYYRSPSGDFIGQGETRVYLAPSSRILPSRNSDNGVQMMLDGTGGSSMTLEMAAPNDATIVPGTYENASRWPFQPAPSPGLSFYGNGRGCNEVAGRFVVHEAVYGAGGEVERFAADFEHRCELSGPPLFGEVRLNSTVPFSYLVEPPPRMSNISTRGMVLTGNDVMIGGFVIGAGVATKRVAIVATGPSLAAFGIGNPLANPTLTLVRSSDQAIVAANDDWGSAANAAQLQAAGFAPTHVLEAGILADLTPGAYTAIVSGAGDGTGTTVLGVYEVGQPEVPLVNISTRGRVETGNDVMIGGFVVQGNEPRTVAIVGTGPSLSAFGISNPLANPTLTLVRSSDQAVLATNDDWGGGVNANVLQFVGFAPSNPLESAILVTLPPGAYTAILAGVGGGTGVGVIGVYAVD
jgi:hypothetical protein